MGEIANGQIRPDGLKEMAKVIRIAQRILDYSVDDYRLTVVLEIPADNFIAVLG